ncbi:developmentally regulated GTP-binding protein, putative [Rhizoctonia solani AG-3 Rhs1AP]|uniref:Developmentally regulated GTP-binding protein, putative n=1 Tax=Rhizoctonia solani AG-3 Rhs1AP TaxID=1086054 RepID=X8JS74_9AGAM|nr:developmentally regulated GTP-binding protein, putative [Rhizoctonia solani AG-3 Rhs1AP]
MNTDHEIALMYASSPWGLFQPRNNFYSPFSNVILRVVQPPRPSLEDMLLQFFTGDAVTTLPTEPDSTQPEPQAEDETSKSNDSTPNFDLSERLAREMQEQEDREWEMRNRATALRSQFGEYMSIFGAPGSNLGPMFPREQVNAEAGPSMIKKATPTSSKSSSTSGWSRLYQDQKVTENNESSSDESEKVSGKKPARASDFVTEGYSPSELLDNLEAHLRQEINQFDFPEQLEFQKGTHTPVLLHTANNAAVHSFEKALLDVRANLGLIKIGDDDVVERKSYIDGKIRRELGDLDRRLLEAWAAKRRYSPVMDSSVTM